MIKRHNREHSRDALKRIINEEKFKITSTKLIKTYIKNQLIHSINQKKLQVKI